VRELELAHLVRRQQWNGLHLGISRLLALLLKIWQWQLAVCSAVSCTETCSMSIYSIQEIW
jgi:hypothetical protein